jgi:hypothetical protein
MTPFSPNAPVYAGAVGVFLGIVFLLVYFYRRIRWLAGAGKRGGKKPDRPRLWASLRNFVLIMLWTAVFGMILFMGFFFRAYQAFTYEKPVARVVTQSGESDGRHQLTLTQFGADGGETVRQYPITGDQWMLEGDILKWPNWLNFLGKHTRFRLTRLRGRYIQASDELSKEATVYPLVRDEDHPVWRYLYRFGHKTPFVSTVYGNSVFQDAGEDARYLVFVGTSGFIVRREEESRQ